MKKTMASLVAAGLLALGAGAAHADGYNGAPSRDFAPMVSDNDWSGFYLNGSLGYGWADTGVDIAAFDVPFVIGDGEPDGFLGSVGLGYDWTFGRGLVFGVFGDYTFGELDDDISFRFADGDPIDGGLKGKAEYDNMWAIGGRAGYVIHNDMLIYGAVGYTSADFEFEGLKEDLDGYFVAAGIDRRLCDNLYLTAQYRYSDFDESSSSATGTSEGKYRKCGGETCEFDVESDHEIHSVRVGLSYKFGSRREEAVPLK